jgi:hypothetical protein
LRCSPKTGPAQMVIWAAPRGQEHRGATAEWLSSSSLNSPGPQVIDVRSRESSPDSYPGGGSCYPAILLAAAISALTPLRSPDHLHPSSLPRLQSTHRSHVGALELERAALAAAETGLAAGSSRRRCAHDLGGREGRDVRAAEFRRGIGASLVGGIWSTSSAEGITRLANPA